MNAPIERKRPPPFEIFFSRLEIKLSPADLERVRFAYFVSKYGHASQKRDSGERYFDHPKAAAWIYIHELGGMDAHTIIILLLHDLCEDAYLLTPYRIDMNFGDEIALDLFALTKLPKGKETTEEYLKRVIARGARAIIAKLCDRLHNIRTLDGCEAEKRQKTIEETRTFHMTLLLPALRAVGPEWHACADALEKRFEEALG